MIRARGRTVASGSGNEKAAVTIDDATVSDEALLARLRDRDDDDAALATLYDRHGRAAYALALRVVGDGGTAEDVVQDAFVTIWRRAETYHPERGTPRAWLLTVVRNRAIDVLRSPARAGPPTTPVDSLVLAAPDSPEEDAVRAAEGGVVREALAELPPEQRAVVDLAYFAGLTYPEVAERMGVPLGTVKSRMRLALERLRALLRTHDPRPGAGPGP